MQLKWILKHDTVQKGKKKETGKTYVRKGAGSQEQEKKVYWK